MKIWLAGIGVTINLLSDDDEATVDVGAGAGSSPDSVIVGTGPGAAVSETGAEAEDGGMEGRIDVEGTTVTVMAGGRGTVM